MRGRRKYAAVRPLLLLCAAGMRLVPRAVCSFLLCLFRHFPTQCGIAARYVLIHALAKGCGDCVAVFEGAYLCGLEEAEFGDNVSIHEMCYIDATGGLQIGSDVSIAHATTIMTTNHDYDTRSNIRDGRVIHSKVTIGDDVWVGSGVRILAGVSIGKHVVIGAGAVVTKNIPSNSVAAGVPACVIKSTRNES